MEREEVHRTMGFDAPQLQKALYYPELWWDATVQTVPAGTSLQDPLMALNDFSSANLFLRLVNVTTYQQSGVVLNVTADNVVTPALFTQVRPNGSPGYGSWIAHKQLLANLYNGSTGSLTLQADFGLEIWSLVDAFRYLFNYPAPGGMTQEQVGASLPGNLREMIDDGLRPLTFDEVLRREYQVWQEKEVTFAGPVNASQRSTVYSEVVPAGHVYAVRGFSVDASSGGSLSLAQQVSAGLQLHISRDSQPDVLTPGLAGMSMFRWIPLWVPALRQLTVELSAAQNYATVPMYLLIADMMLSDIEEIRWSAVTGAVQTPANAKLWRFVQAGGW
jgi:hypothetical protein